MPLHYPQLTHLISGNTAGATALISTGTMVLAGGNNITLSQNGNSVTISGGAGGGGFQSAGFSTQGNTSGDTGFASQSIQFVGGNNITLSGSTAAGQITITISGANAGGAQTGISGIQVSDTTYTSGTVTFRNANGISFGSSGANGISASYTVPNVPAQTNQTGGIYHVGNTTGESSSSTYDARTLSFRGDGIISLGWSNGSVRISASVPAQTNQSLGIYGLGNTTGESSSSTYDARTLSIRGDGIVSVGWSNGSFRVSASVAAQTNQTLGLYALGNTTGQSSSSTFDARTISFVGQGIASVGFSNGSVNISVPAGGGAAFSAGASNLGNTAGDTGVVSNRLVLVGSNNITLSGSTNGGSATLSIIGGAGGGGGAALGISNLGNTAGTSGTVSTGNYIFVGSGVISLSQSSSGSNGTLSILAPATSSIVGTQGIAISTAGSTISIGVATNTMWFPYNEAINVAGQQGQASLHIFPVDRLDPVQFDRIAFPVLLSASSNSTGSLTVSFWMGLYTKTNATLSRAYSSSTSLGITYSGSANSTIYSGIRLITMGWTTTINANRYYVGIVSRTTTGGTNASFSQVLISQLNSNFSGLMGVATNASMQWPAGAGVYSATTSGIPDSIGFSQLQGTQSIAGRPPSWFARSGTE